MDSEKSIFTLVSDYEMYKNDKNNIDQDTVIFVEESGKEKIIALETEYNFVPSGGSNGQVLSKTSDGTKWTTISYLNSNEINNYYNKEEVDKKFNESIWIGSENDYELLDEINHNTLYFITE